MSFNTTIENNLSNAYSTWNEEAQMWKCETDPRDPAVMKIRKGGFSFGGFDPDLLAEPDIFQAITKAAQCGATKPCASVNQWQELKRLSPSKFSEYQGYLVPYWEMEEMLKGLRTPDARQEELELVCAEVDEEEARAEQEDEIARLQEVIKNLEAKVTSDEERIAYSSAKHFKTAQVMVLLNLSQQSVTKKAATGELPAVKSFCNHFTKGEWLFDRAAILELLANENGAAH